MFNFECEGFDADVLSITDFLDQYHVHTRTFLEQYGPKHLIQMENKTRTSHTSKTDALLAIGNLRENQIYEF